MRSSWSWFVLPINAPRHAAVGRNPESAVPPGRLTRSRRSLPTVCASVSRSGASPAAPSTRVATRSWAAARSHPRRYPANTLRLGRGAPLVNIVPLDTIRQGSQVPECGHVGATTGRSPGPHDLARSQRVNATASANFSEGGSHPSVCRGRPLSSAATASSRAWVIGVKSVPWGRPRPPDRGTPAGQRHQPAHLAERRPERPTDGSQRLPGWVASPDLRLLLRGQSCPYHWHPPWCARAVSMCSPRWCVDPLNPHRIVMGRGAAILPRRCSANALNAASTESLTKPSSP